MKFLFPLILFLGALTALPAQEIPPSTSQQLEEITAATESETEDDGFIQELEHFLRRPLELNRATATEFEAFPFLTPVQVNSFIRYRELLGPLTGVYELQAVPGWDLATIRLLLPYITVVQSPTRQEIVEAAKSGEHMFLFRTSGLVPGGDPGENGYTGNALKVFFRYRYTYKNRLQWGMTAEKDAGEGFFGSAQKLGFDFYSAHVFLKNSGVVRALVMGDYTVNMGQGLVHWQSLAFGKGGEASVLKRQSPVIKPYTSSGEFNFMRGAAITLAKKRLSGTLLFSLRKLDANLASGSVSSLVNSGYHRTEAEIADRHILPVLTTGTRMTYQAGNFQAGLSGMLYRFGLPIAKSDEPYNLYSLNHNRWWNAAMDHSYTYKNFHLFGEMALSRNAGMGFMEGLLVSLHRDVDLSVLYRWISPAYQSLWGNAFTESGLPSNETGIYTGLSLRPSSSVRIDLFGDLFRFPWPRYRINAPAGGSEYSVQCLFTPSKHSSLQIRFRTRSKPQNEDSVNSPSRQVGHQVSRNLRFHLSQRISEKLSVRTRAEFNLVKSSLTAHQGFLFFTEFIGKAPGHRLGFSGRVAVFDTDNYDSRVYSFESNVLYSYSIPAFAGKGGRFYLNLEYDLSRRITLWGRVSATIYDGATLNESSPGADHKQFQADWTLQARVSL